MSTAPVVHINRPPTIALRRIMHCPTENRRRRFAGFDAFWYGPTWICLGCGERFGDGGRLERPFKPRWREESKQYGRRLWAEGVRIGSPEDKQWIAEQMAAHGIGQDAPQEDQ